MTKFKSLISAAPLSLALLTLASSPAQARSKHHRSVQRAPASRISHAKELLGNHYKHSVVRVGEHWVDLSSEIRQWTRRAMKHSSKKVAAAVAQTILKESSRYRLDPVFLAAVIQSESSFNPRIRGSAGEIGMMQLLPETAEWIAKKYNLPWKGPKTLYNPVMNIRIGAAYFDLLRDRFDNQSRLYLSAYNMGAKNVDRALKKHIWPKDYASRVMKHYIGYYREIKLASSELRH